MKVFIDGRSDFYGDKLMTDFRDVQTLEPGWEDVIAKHDIQAFLIEDDTPLSARLDAEPDKWRRVFTGPIEAVFVRAMQAQCDHERSASQRAQARMACNLFGDCGPARYGRLVGWCAPCLYRCLATDEDPTEAKICAAARTAASSRSGRSRTPRGGLS